MNALILVGIAGVLLILAAIFFVKRLLWLAINSVVGIFALLGWNALFTPVVINVWSVLFVAIGGILGLIVVVVLHILGIAF